MTSLRRSALAQEILPVLACSILVNGVLLATWFLSLDLSAHLADLLYSLLLVNTALAALVIFTGARALGRAAVLDALPPPPVAALEIAAGSSPSDWTLRFARERDQLHARAFAERELTVKEDLEFFGAWIHELKTPISVLRLVAEKGDHPEADEISRQLDRLEQHASRAMYHLRSSSLAQDMMIVPVALEPLVQERVRAMARSFIEKRIGVSVTGEFGEVTSDRKWLGFVIDQILQNAHRYTEPRGSVAVIGRMESDGPVVQIHDSGIGIPPEDLPRVFERSFTGERGREFGSSTGMGLYLARKMTRRLGHAIGIVSPSSYWETPRGTNVVLRFPKWHDAIGQVEPRPTNLTES